MCGRYALLTSTPEIARILGVAGAEAVVDPRYNVAPTQKMPVARINAGGEAELVTMRWGLVPAWAKDVKIGNKLINARAETAAEKPSFRAAMRRRRCLVPIDGYYEWRRQPDGRKQPYFISPKKGETAFLAGLWESWHDRTMDELVTSYTILTAPAGPPVASIHHRMPVVVQPSERDAWLRLPPEQNRALAELLDQQIAQSQTLAFSICPVSTAVNSPRNDDPRCIQAIA